MMAPPKQSRVSSMRGKLYASLMVRALSLRKSMQNHREPSFFLTRMTALAQGLLDFQIAPTSIISFKCFFNLIKQIGWNSMIPILEGCIVVESDFVFDH